MTRKERLGKRLLENHSFNRLPLGLASSLAASLLLHARNGSVARVVMRTQNRLLKRRRICQQLFLVLLLVGNLLNRRAVEVGTAFDTLVGLRWFRETSGSGATSKVRLIPAVRGLNGLGVRERWLLDTASSVRAVHYSPCPRDLLRGSELEVVGDRFLARVGTPAYLLLDNLGSYLSGLGRRGVLLRVGADGLLPLLVLAIVYISDVEVHDLHSVRPLRRHLVGERAPRSLALLLFGKGLLLAHALTHKALVGFGPRRVHGSDVVLVCNSDRRVLQVMRALVFPWRVDWV